MRKPGDWMQLPIDERILEILESSGLILSPAIIAKNIEKTRPEVNRRLSVLVEYGLVERVERGYYVIAERGEEYLTGEFDATTLDEDDGE
jgi:predicted transcriptional regulator